MASRVRLAFVGCGNCLRISFGPVLPYVEGLEVVAGVDPSDEALAHAQTAYGFRAGYHTLEECLKKESVDAVLIATPVYEHRDLALFCADRGIHVLLEKPMARSIAECDEIIAAHEKAGTVLMMAFMKRFNRTMLRVEELMKEGAIGQVMGIRHNWDWGGNEGVVFGSAWRGFLQTWGGQWQDHGSHSVDLAHWWAGPIRSVLATFEITDPTYSVETDYNVICTHESGARSVHLSTKFFHQEGQERYQIFGETGTIDLSHSAGVWQYTTPYEAFIHRWGRIRESIKPPFSQNWLEEGKQFGQYKVELDHFVDCVRENKRPRTDGQSGRSVMEVICAAYLSAFEHREVSLPLSDSFDLEAFFKGMDKHIPPRYRV